MIPFLRVKVLFSLDKIHLMQLAAERAAAQIRAESPSYQVSVTYGDATLSATCKDVIDACMAKK